MDKALLYIVLGIAGLAIIGSAITVFMLNRIVKTVYKIVDELNDTPLEIAEADHQNVKNDIQTVKVNRRKFRLFKRKQKFTN
jgi:hypothetical protein